MSELLKSAGLLGDLIRHDAIMREALEAKWSGQFELAAALEREAAKLLPEAREEGAKEKES